MTYKKWWVLGISVMMILALLMMVLPRVLPQLIVNQISSSYVKGNAPKNEDLDGFLQRDLKKFFKAKYHRDISIKYEFLRDGPTQSGVAYPKYYLWVTISAKGSIIDDGAVRVAAIAQKAFEVTDFLKRAELSDNRIYEVFPGAVCERIKMKL